MEESGFLSVVSEELERLDSFLDQLLDGEKPLLDPNQRRDQKYIEYLHALYPENFDDVLERSLDTRPEGYYITPEQEQNGDDKLVKQLNTRVHPLHDNLSRVNESLFQRASQIRMRNFVVAGADMHFRDRRDYEGVYDRSENMFLHAKGDVVSLSQTVKLLKKVVSGEDLSERSILIDNTSERFSAVLDVLGLDYPEAVDSLNKHLSGAGSGAIIAVVDEKNTAIGRMQAIAVDCERKLAKLPQIIPETVFQSTSSPEKMQDVRRSHRAYRSTLQIKNAVALGGHSEHDPEFQGTCAGNDYAKAILTIQDKTDNRYVDMALDDMGLDKKETGIFFYDGSETMAERGLRETEVFAPYLKETPPLTEFPGAETKPLSQAVGNKADYYKLISLGLDEIEKKEGRPVDKRLTDSCAVIYMPLHQEDLDNPRYYAFKATTPLELQLELDPLIAVNQEGDEFKTQRHYQKPLDRVESLAELESYNDPWMYQELAIARAVRGMWSATRVAKAKIDLKAEFDGARKVTVHCPYPISTELENEYRGKLAKRGLHVSVADDSPNSIADIRNTINSAQALLIPCEGTQRADRFYTDQILLPASAIVEKQLSNPKTADLPIVFHQRGESKYSPFERISNHLKRAGMVTQDRNHLYVGTTKVKNVASYVKETLLHAQSYDQFDKHKKANLPKLNKAVVFLESATSKHPVDLNNAYNLAVNCGLNGFDNISGFGMSGPMGMVSWAGLQLRREGWDDHTVMGIQDPNAMKTEGAPFEAMRSIMGEGYGVVAPDIFVRMWQMLQLDHLQKDPDMEMVAVAQGAGIGGLQEIVFIMSLKEMGVPGADRIHLIIENAERELPSGVVAPHDVLLDIMDERGDISEEKGVYATTSPAETLMTIGDVTGQEVTYFPVQNPVDTVHPFEDVKNPLYDWLLKRGEWDSSAKTIAQVYDEVMAMRSECDQKLQFD